MDFVVAGFGLGAAIILLGFVIRDLGPLGRRSRLADPVAGHQRDWKGLCQEIGASLIGGGLALCGITLVPLLLGASDAAGARVVLATSMLLLGVVGVRTMQSVRRYRRWGADLPTWTPAAAQPLPQPKRDPAAAWPAPPKIAAAQPAPSSQERPPGEPEFGETAKSGERATILRRFSSPLLSDIAPDQDADGRFRSEILADVVPAEPEPESPAGFRSPLLAAMVADGSVTDDASKETPSRDEATVSQASLNSTGSPAEAAAADADHHDEPDTQPEADSSVATTVPADR